MTKDLKEFMSNLTIGKERSKYQDSKGNIMTFKTCDLFPSSAYLTLTETEYNNALFNGTIKKDEYNTTKITKPVPKNTITGKDKDKNTIVDQEVEAYEVWVVANQFGYTTSFNNQYEAVKLVEDIEEKLANE